MSALHSIYLTTRGVLFALGATCFSVACSPSSSPSTGAASETSPVTSPVTVQVSTLSEGEALPVPPAFEALDYAALGAPVGTREIHERVFSDYRRDRPTLAELKANAKGSEIVLFIATHAYAMTDRLWALQMMASLPTAQGRTMALAWVNDVDTYARLRCASVGVLGAYNLITDDAVRAAVMLASEATDACTREAALALLGD